MKARVADKRDHTYVRTMWRSIVVLILALAAVACDGDQSAPEGDSPQEGATSATDTGVTTISESTTTTSEDRAPAEMLFADHLSRGDCFDNRIDDDGESDYSEPPLMVACDDPHDNEVVLVAETPEGPDEAYPGDEAMSEHFGKVCVPAFNEFLGITGEDDPPVGGYYLAPQGEQEWATGSRSYACILHLPGEARLEGSLEDAGLAVFPAGFPEDAPTPDGLELEFVDIEVDSPPGEDEWDVDPEGLNVARYGHDAPIAEAKEAFLAAVDASGWTIEQRDGFGSLGLGTEFFDVRKDGRRLVVEAWELEGNTTSFDYFFRPER